MKRIVFILMALYIIIAACGNKEDDKNPAPTPAEQYAGCCGTAPQQMVIGSGKIFIPNAFSPNGDGVNDVFFPLANSGIALIQSFRVLDRYKNELLRYSYFQPNDPLLGWDGRLSADSTYEGLFYYEISAINMSGDQLAEEGSACSIVCRPGALLPIENGNNCGFSIQTNGDGDFNPALPNFENICY